MRAALAGFAAVAALSVALRAPVVDLPFERDEGEYAYIAQRWRAGDVPYRDAFDQKPPAVFAFYALAFALGGETPGAVRWTAQGLTLVTLAAVAALGARRFSTAAGLAAAAFAALLAVHPGWLGNAVNTEALAIAALAVGAWTALRGGIPLALTTGVLGGAALLCKPVVAPIVAFELATAAWQTRRRALGAVAGAAGVVAAIAPVAAYFAAAGAWEAFLDATLWNNLAYASGLPLALYPGYFRVNFAPSLPAFGAIYAAAAAAPLLLATGWGGAAADARARRSVAWLAGWLAVSLLSVAAGGYFREHYFLLAAPPLALLAGAGIDAAARRLTSSPRAAAALAAAAVLAILGWAVARAGWYFAPGPAAAKLQRLYGSNPFPEAPVLGRWLAERSGPEDRAFVYGSEPELLFYAGLRSASRYIFVYPLTMAMGRAAERQREALAELDAAPPRWVIAVFVDTSLAARPGTPPELREGLRARLERGYRIAAVVPFDRERSGRVIAGRAAETLWRERPLWDGATPWAAYVVWERKGDPPGP